MRRKAQTEGCIAALLRRYPANPGRTLPRIRISALRAGTSYRGSETPPAGGSARIVPQTLRCRRPQAAGEIARPTRHPQAGGDTKSTSPLPGPPAGRCKHRPLRRGGAPRLSTARHACCPRLCRLFTLHCRAGVHARRGGLAPARKDIGGARRRTPQSADADSSPCRGAFRAAVFPKPPLEGEVDAPQGADGGVHCRLAPQVSCKLRQGLAPMFRRG